MKPLWIISFQALPKSVHVLYTSVKRKRGSNSYWHLQCTRTVNYKITYEGISSKEFVTGFLTRVWSFVNHLTP